MSELSKLITKLQKSIISKESYINTIKYPYLLVSSLQELNGLIGNEKVKDAVAEQITYLISAKMREIANPHLKQDKPMLNTLLYGPPGVGKTMIGTKLAKIFYSLGHIKGKQSSSADGNISSKIKGYFGNMSDPNDINMIIASLAIIIGILGMVVSTLTSMYTKLGGKLMLIMIVSAIILILAALYFIFSEQSIGEVYDTEDVMKSSSQNMFPPDNAIIKIVSRTDFIGQYVGWSDKKTLDLLNDSLGKVLFVDEAYSLVNDERDSFGNEALTTLNLFLSQHPNEIIVIFAGYEDKMKSKIFASQEGLERRFMWKFDCSGYTSEQLYNIFKHQLNISGWGIDDEENTKPLFVQYKHIFPAFGGDTERLSFFAKLEHSKNYITSGGKIPNETLSVEHIKNGILKLKENSMDKSKEYSNNDPLSEMFNMFKQHQQRKSTVTVETADSPTYLNDQAYM